jgi:hypothetical protein
MSAFIVDADCMDRVVGFILNNSTAFCGIVTSMPNAGDKIGAILYTMNVESVNFRYREEEPAPSYAYYATPFTAEQAFRDIRSLIYQCSEGGPFENSAAYVELDALAGTAQQQAESAKKEKAAKLAAIPTKFISVAETAKLIRAALKKAFPTVKFAVRSKKYAGGASINVSWTDGPTAKQVEAITGQFQSAGFDGSIDFGYSVSHWLMPDGTIQIARNSGSACTGGYDEGCDNPQPHPDAVKVHFGSSYVFADRSYSVPMVRRALDKLERTWGGFSAADVEVAECEYGGGAYVRAGGIPLHNAGDYLDSLVAKELARRTNVAG